MLFPKKQVYPILTPQICFRDKYANLNAYVEMNPSMNIDEMGNVIILVRCVNYRKFFDRQFTMYENHSYSHYYIFRGAIQNDGQPLDIDNYSIEHLKHEYSRQTYATYWKGIEDIRFIDSENVLTIVPECNPGGNPSIFWAKLDGSMLHSFVDCRPNIVEKNWMPFNKNKVIYSLEPFVVKDILDDNQTTIDVSEENKQLLKGYHGSTNGVQYNDKYLLFLIHLNKDKVYHKWMLFNPDTCEVKLSSEFIFFRHAYIEFTCSLCKYNERMFISVGVNDDKAYIIETDCSTINNFIGCID